MTNATVSYDPLAPDVLADPYPYYTELRRHAPVQHVPSLGLWAVSRHRDVRRVMHEHTTFSSQAMAAAVARPADFAAEVGVRSDDDVEPISIIGTDGETHTRLRQIVNRGFTPRRMAELEPRVRELTQGFVRDLIAAGSGDLQADFAVPLPTVVIAELLGVDPERRGDFRRWSEHMVVAVFEQPDAHRRQEIVASAEEMMAWLDDVIAERSGRAAPDLISVLLRAELDGGALSHDELRTFVVTLLVAGSITTAYLIGNAALAILEHPDAYEQVRADPTLVGGLVEEALRYDAPTQMMLRTATQETEIAGTVIPRGATVAPLLGSANRDDAVFGAPDRFVLTRNPTEHLTFGHGTHFCLGAALARLEARIAFDELFARAPRIEPAGDVGRTTSLVFRGPTSLPVRLAG
jgi:cytochrome P450